MKNLSTNPTQDLPKCSKVKTPKPRHQARGGMFTGIKHDICSERPKYYSREKSTREKGHFDDHICLHGCSIFLLFFWSINWKGRLRLEINTFEWWPS